MSVSNTDTIIAIASPLGNSHQAIIRLSGPASLGLIEDSFVPLQKHPACATADPPNAFGEAGRWGSFSTVQGHLVLPSSVHRFIDNGIAKESRRGGACPLPLGDHKGRPYKIQARLYVMKSPRSYTREDVVEIHTLGVLPLLNLIIEDFTRRGARLAQPGEFTQRAFLNRRIDLAQAEAVLGIIQSRNEQELTLATRQLTGQFSRHLRKIKQDMVDLLAHLELSLDFSDQDIEILSLSEVKSRLNGLLKQIEVFLSSKTRPVYKEGIKVVICGRPNVGKSSLFNRLLGKDRAIVTIIPGTTTDVMEGHLKMADTNFRLFDTAGLGEIGLSNNYDSVHRMAQERAKLILKDADIFLLIVDGSKPLGEEDRTIFDNLNASRLPDRQTRLTARLPARQVGQAGTIIVINKIDLPVKTNSHKIRQFLGRDLPVLPTSARNGKGISGLKKYLAQTVSEMGVDRSSSEYSINTRHRISLTKTHEGLKASLKIAETETNAHIKSGDLMALELREALNGVGEVLGDPARTGRGGEILNHIFSQFCIGK